MNGKRYGIAPATRLLGQPGQTHTGFGEWATGRVDNIRVIPNQVIDLRYATSNHFVGYDDVSRSAVAWCTN